MHVLLTAILGWPLLGAACILLLTKEKKAPLCRHVALFFSSVELVLVSAVLYEVCIEDSDGLFFLVQKVPWMRLSLAADRELLITYFLGVDGINLPLLLLAALVGWVGVVASWRVEKQLKLYFFWYLVLLGCTMGVFMSLDLFLFFLFFEGLLIPVYFLIGIWGGTKREHAAVRFFLYTFCGSLMILAVLLALCLIAPIQEGTQHIHTLDLPALAERMTEQKLFSPSFARSGWHTAEVLCLLLFLGFAIKFAVVPFHTWLPVAHVEASTALSLVLSGVLLKAGGYGIIRINYGIFPHTMGSFSHWIALLGAVGILYGGLNALGQRDLKRLIAYASLAHMGFVLIGLSSSTLSGFSGAVYQMVSHGILSPALFLVAGGLEDRFGHRNINDYSGLSTHFPRYTLMTAFFFFAYLGTPGASTFAAEAQVLMGAFSAHLQDKMSMSLTVCLLAGIFLAALYLLWSFQRIFYGPYWIKNSEKTKALDLTNRERLMLIPLAVLTLLLGLLPQFLLKIIRPALLRWYPFLLD